LSSNDNSRGPGQSALSALHGAVGRGNGRGYPPDHANDLMEALAAFWSVTKEDLIVGTGSGPILEGSVRAFCAADKPLVMKQAMEVFRRVLTTKSTAQG
jgi:histidinol-phosphate/aromatic aminotransferase/cobyric acid decarboxylase-like protein